MIYFIYYLLLNLLKNICQLVEAPVSANPGEAEKMSVTGAVRLQE